jgi:hypothetical protein
MILQPWVTLAPLGLSNKFQVWYLKFQIFNIMTNHKNQTMEQNATLFSNYTCPPRRFWYKEQTSLEIYLLIKLIFV